MLWPTRLPLASAAIVLLTTACLAQSEPDREFFKGKQIQLLISHPAGGGYDAYARLAARHLGAFIEGGPSVIPQNMPGAAGIVMTNSMAAQQRADGSVIALGPGSLAVADLLGFPNVRFSARTLSWIGSMNSDVGVSISSANSKVVTAQDLFTHDLVTGGSGPGDNSVRLPTALNHVLGTKFKVIPGYAGSAALTLALERAEIAGIGGINYSSILANRPDWLTQKKIHLLLQLSLKGRPDLKGVPTVLDLAKNDRERKTLELIFSQTEIARVIFGPPRMERLETLRRAFAEMIKDPAFLRDAEKMQIEINNPMTGEDVKSLVDRIQSSSPDIVRHASEAIRPG